MVRVSWHPLDVMIMVKDGCCSGRHQWTKVARVNVLGKAGTSWRPPYMWEASTVCCLDSVGVGDP